MEQQRVKSRDLVNFEVEWLRDVNEVALHLRHFADESGSAMEEVRLMIPKALATELRYALDRALASASSQT